MTLPTPEQAKAGYHAMWDRAAIEPSKTREVGVVADKIVINRAKYEDIERASGVPWFMIGPIHNRESSLSFKAHLHCGDPLTARTYHVPKGRPVKGNPPFSFQESAIDALTMAPHSLDKVKDWSCERILFETEKYNGWGYLKKGKNSPYLWAGTSEYHGGKYVSDGQYSALAWDNQLGCVALLKELAARDQAVAARLANRQPTMPAEVKNSIAADPKFKEITDKERKARAAGGAATVGGGAGEGAKQTGTVQPETPLLSPLITWTLIGAGVGVFLLAAFLIARKRSAVIARWGA